MELSIREARAQFAKAIEAAERGERVTITRNGKVVAELVAPTVRKTFDWARLEEASRKAGLEQVALDDDWLERFNDPAFGREVFGLGDDWDPARK